MDKRHVIDKRNIKLEDVLKKDYIPFLGGRPNWSKAISADDVLNLEIALNTAHSVEEFLSRA
jgi:hypothetical protein